MATYDIRRVTDSLGGVYIGGPLTLDTARNAKDAYARAKAIRGIIYLSGTDIGWARETGWINDEGDYLGVAELDGLDRLTSAEIARLIVESERIKGGR